MSSIPIFEMRPMPRTTEFSVPAEVADVYGEVEATPYAGELFFRLCVRQRPLNSILHLHNRTDRTLPHLRGSQVTRWPPGGSRQKRPEDKQ